MKVKVNIESQSQQWKLKSTLKVKVNIESQSQRWNLKSTLKVKVNQLKSILKLMSQVLRSEEEEEEEEEER